MRRAFLCLLLVGVLILTACGKKNQSKDPAPENTPASGQNGQTVTITPAEKKPYNLFVSEVMADNSRLYLGNEYDWIEIGSREAKEVSLAGYYLTDDPASAAMLSLEGYTIPANGYVVIPLPDDAPFHLNTDGETVSLLCRGEVISELTYTAEIGTRSASADGVLSHATPGYPNTEEGYAEYLSNLVLPEIILSEVVSSSDSTYDYAELQNRTDHAVSLLGYSLSDKRSDLTRYALPDVTVEAGGYYVIYCSGLSEPGHAPFKIGSNGETVYLSKDGALVDLIRVPDDLEKNKSYGRNGNELVYMETMTPSAPNATGFASRVSVPVPNVTPGLYDDPVTVTLSGEGTVYYTLDGSRPTRNSAVYTGPITVDKVTTIRTFSAQGDRASDIVAYTYLVGVSHTLPVIYVSLPQDSLSSVKDNIYSDIEKECVFSLYENGEMCFSVPCGFCLHGNESRQGGKQNFQLRFRSEYGLGKLRYPLFDDIDVTQFNSLLLKSGSEDYTMAMMRDELCTGLTRNGRTHLYTLACKPCVLYLGNRYWGIYYLRERFSDDYVADHFSVSESSVDLLFSYAGVQSGSSNDWFSLLSYCRSHDLSVDEYYQHVIDQIDPLSLMDWYICRSYMGDKDIGNIRWFRSSEYDNKWRWMYFDLDWAFWHTDDNPVTWLIKNNDYHVLMYNLLKNPEFKDMFLRRYAELMDSFLNEKVITAEIDRYVAFLEPEIEKDRERWDYSVSGWRSSVQALYDYVKGEARTKNVLRDIKNYFNLSDAQMKEYFGDKWQ
ncbi:MAG: CotH kinase family protein [Lachnospiraceae bacterium]|nr:CotH kinase family protein [Lachnospiraceae bacterium]